MAIASHRRHRLGALALGSVLLLAACGSGEGSDEAANTVAPPPDDIELDDSADIPANQLPDVIVDDVLAGNKVNLRNIVPTDTPILLWMYAPH